MQNKPIVTRSGRWVLLPVLLATGALAVLAPSAPPAAPATDAAARQGGSPQSPLSGLGTYTVTTSADNGVGSLRQAIANSNGHATGPNQIVFSIPGSGSHSIGLQSCLPDATVPVVIDGYSQPGASPNTLAIGDNAVLKIELDGASGCPTNPGISLRGGGSTVKGLAIHGFPWAGIELINKGGDVVAGNFIGTDITGTQPLSNGYGIYVDGVSTNTIGGLTAADRNLVSGNALDGINITNFGLLITPTHNLIQGNYIGTNAAGTVALGNAGSGVDILGGTSNTIGATPAVSGSSSALGPANGLFPPGNLVSGNHQDGLGLHFGADQNVVAGNLVGVAADGVSPLGNTFDGVNIVDSSFNMIGGDISTTFALTLSVCTGMCNNIFNNGGAGVRVVQGSGRAHGNTILSNRIGANAQGGIRFSSDPVAKCADPTRPNDGITAPKLTVTGHYKVVITIDCLPFTDYRVQVYENNLPCDRQYERLFDTSDLTTGADGTAFAQFFHGYSQEVCYTATMTPVNGGQLGSTSQDALLMLFLPLVKR